MSGYGRVAEARRQDEGQPGYHLPGDAHPVGAWCHCSVGATRISLQDEGTKYQSLIWRKTLPHPLGISRSRAPRCRGGKQQKERAEREGGGEAGPGPPGEGARSFPGYKTARPGPGEQSSTEGERGTERHGAALLGPPCPAPGGAEVTGAVGNRERERPQSASSPGSGSGSAAAERGGLLCVSSPLPCAYPLPKMVSDSKPPRSRAGGTPVPSLRELRTHSHPSPSDMSWKDTRMQNSASALLPLPSDFCVI